MATINILDSFVYNRIAAGEVVERPFSVIKELAENSIDAGATNICVEITDGGVTSISVKDNGGGIEKSQLKAALLPHATSKIKDACDLEAIATLGFRGEALASIASVSKIRIISKPKEQDFGAEISAEGGKIKEVIDCGAADGTEITVNNLFFNTPARQKFLKSYKAEEGDVSNLITRFILGNPHISFKYSANGKTVYQSYGDGVESAMLNVYGTGIIKDCFYIDTEKNGIKIQGYVGKHYFTKPNRTYQSLFLNGRYILNTTVASAIGNAYGSYLMKRQYPFYVLSIIMPPETVDVNVHPNKTDVRFSNNQVVYGSIYSVISKVLDGTSEAVSIIKEPEKQTVVKSTNQQQIIKQTDKNYVTHNYDFTPLPKASITLNDVKNDYTDIEKAIQKKPEPKTDIFAENKKYLEELFKQKEAEKAAEQQKIQETRLDLTLIGQALNTFLIFEDGRDLYFIDQHAAHERILFDRFCENLKNDTLTVQPLLVPYILSVNSQENEFLVSKTQYFKELGFDLEEFGYNTYKISALPADVADMDLGKFFDDCFSDLNFFKTETMPDIIRDKVASKACKAAIKSGDKLDENDIKTLLQLMKGNLGLKCPHGRPVAIKISRTEIDKWFKRIV